ncbi:Spy0128 family protein [Collinsella intestinalis]|uniref:DUF11 domain-containing protein n=1 Tax=Collinsella intestinalis TaxID=147207 RepID=A0A414NER3_9ACTN|nr:FctA domain-containing protein [Collinsella intestinalis]RHF38235.1 DUF11 domain-containing protein [Collinsella intestinalis]
MRSAVRRLARVLPSAMLGAALALTAVAPAAKAAPADAEPTPWAAGDKTVVVDEPTITTWEGVAKDDTANVGRIWTDKSVFNEDVELLGGIESVIKKDDSDFLVGLSALSSTSNTITTTTSAQPLDIVLVLDVSGSMGENITSTTYEPTYSINTSGFKTYYAKLPNGKFKKIDRKTTGFIIETFDHWELDGAKVAPLESASDATPGRIQFYTATVSRTTRLAALKNAAYGFIDSTAKANGAISNPEKQHRVSIVSFSSDASIVQSLTACTDGTKDGIKQAVGRLNRGGDTYPGKAMEKAATAFRAAPRTDARKVVVFFTDGNPAPAGTDDFNADLANSGVTGSKRLKDDGATVYSIGIFEGADPSKDEATTNNCFNAYMHAMSSNYPKATKWNNLGARAENSDYYKAATDADELNSIFQEISNEINSGTGTPTETIDGMANKSGYITFTDELGAYMQVDGFKTLIFADKEFSLQSKTTDGFVDTYAYEGTGGNALYPDGNVKDIVVQVKRSNDLAKGDIVTVKIPASLIPLRNFKVESNDGAANMGIDEAYPLRIFYGVSIKPGVRNAVLSGTADDALRAYIKNNSDEGGKTAFYSNLYDGANVEGNKLLGNTTATFVPSKVNSFYYFTEDTTLYTDDACANPLREKPESGKTYYYKRAYYKQNADGKTATKDWAITQFKGANFDALTTYWGKAPDGTYFIKAGSPRLTRIDALTLGKEENLTGTATEVINPRWDNINNPYEINVNLGNNGKLSVEMPGTLSITKDARITPGKNIDPSVLEGKQFKFEISIPSAAGKTLKADVKNAQGEVVSEAFDMVFNKDGKREQTLKDNETLTIYGLDANTAYTVTEKEIPAGFTQTNATDNKGTITANEVAHAKFENTYDVAAKPIASDDFVKYQKVFDKWEVAEAFDIQLHAVQAGNPMPKGSIYGPDNRGVKIAPATQQHPTGSFGNIVFDRPGTFEYTVSEVKPAGDTMVPGVTYSQAVYKVTVVVEDNGDGTLTVASNTMTKVSNDAGGNLAAPEEISNKTAVFVNKFNAKSTSAAPVAYKRYTNHGGEGTALKSDMFTFKVESKTPGAPLPEDADPDGDGVLFVKNQGEEIPLAQATFGDEHVGYTYAYDISEVIPRGATAENNFTANGMTYDPTVYRAKFQVTFDGVGDQARVEVAISYYKVDGDKEEPLPEGQTPEFNNSYDPADVTLPSDPNDAPLRARKTLVGRDSKKGESFTFELSAADNPTAFALKNGVVVFDGPAGATTMTASVSDLKNGQAEDVPFGNVTFTKPGTYKFNIKENAPADGAGMTYDRTTHEVKVVVTDVDGVLKADVKYTGSVKDAAAFTNTYKAEHTFGTGFKLDVTKTLVGRAQVAGEFGFKIEGVDSGTVMADEASKRLDASEANFKTVAPADSGVPSLMENKLNKLNFTQADAGKTFSYVLCEDIPADDKKLGGVTYDKTTYRIDIKVVDNADGTMGTVTTVAKNVPGAASETVGTYDSADGKDAVTLDFTNTYAAQPVKVDGTKYDLNLYKVLEGRDWREGDTFHFVMKDGGHDDPGAQKAEVDVTADPGTKAGEKVPFNFGGYTFKQPGEYYYTITEVEPAEGAKIPGITYSKNAADIVVNVTDNLKGQLEAEVQVYNDTFTNTYTYSWQPVVVDPDAIKDAAVTKILKGDRGTGLADGEFEFQMATTATAGSLDTVKDADGNAWSATKTATNKADGSVDFGEMSFSAAGTYKVTIKEVKGDAAHMTYDGHEFTYTIEVTYDPATGKLSAKVKDLDPAKATFTNVYFNEKDAKDVTVSGADKPQTSVDGKLVGVGDTLVYTIDWVNNAVDKNGAPVAANVTVTDKIPHGTEYVSASEGGKHENGAVTWKLDNQPAGASGTVTLTVCVTDDAVVTGSVENQASIQIGDNKVTTNATETFVPGKSETTHPDEVKPGETLLTYQIKFHNTDGANAKATVVDELGKGLEYQVGSALVNGKPAEPVVKGSSATGTTLTWNLSGLTADQDVVITFDVKVAAQGPTTVENQATVNGHVSNVETTPFPTKDAKHVYKGEALFDGKLVGVGDVLTFKIQWSHDETLDGENQKVTVVDKLPAGMEPIDGTIKPSGTYDPKAGTITWTFDNARGQQGIVEFQAKVTDEVIEAAKRGEVTNIAKVNNHASQGVSVSVPTKTVAKPEGQSGSIKVGDEVVYTINYKNTEGKNATVTITDVLPAGITYKADSAAPAASYDEANHTLTWTLADVAAGAVGSVSFTGVVNESAIEGGVDNKAGIQLGENGPVISTNTESTKMGTGGLTISKHVKSAIAGVTAPTAEFTFDVTLTDAAGKQLTGTYNYEGDKKGVIENGAGQIKLAHGQSITIKGLPEGAKYKVVETEVDGFTAIADTMNGTIAKNQTAQAAFTNTYTPAPIVIPGGTGSALQVKKVLKGRDWLPNESYSFELQAVTVGAPMPEGVGNVATATADNQPVSFGGISFAKPGEYEYRIVETGASADVNLTFSKAEYKLVVTVKPNGDAFTATSVLTQVKNDAGKTVDEVLQVPGEVMTFTNTYKKPAQGKDVTAEGKPGTSIDGQLVQVGSKLVYTINWVNDAVDETGKAVPAAVTITDVIPAGTAYVKDSATNGGVYNADTKTLTWDLGKQEANASGTVSFTVEVTEDALNNSVVNEADIQIGDNKHETTSKPEVFVPGKTSADDNKGDIQVGDVLTYTVSYANLGNESATVTITDVLPKGLTYVDGSASDSGSFDNRANTLTWTIEDVPAGKTGTVTFQARVNEGAVTEGIGNKAAVQIGDNKVETNTTDPDTKPSVGTLTISKTVEAANDPNAPVDTEKAFDFKVNLKDKAGNTLTGNYAYTIGEEKGTLSSGTTFKLKHGQSIVIEGLPVGATYEVREKPTDGYAATAEGAEGTISANGAAATFINSYSAALPQDSPVTTASLFSKVLTGRDWKTDDTFSFTITPLNGAPEPERREATLTGLTNAADKPVKFGFGAISFTFDHIKDAPVVNGERTKTFVYEVRETEGSIPGVAYDGHVAKLTVTLKDNGEGVLSATTVVDNEAQFTNRYTTKPINPDGDGATGKDGIQIVKTLTGRPIAAGDFAFTMAPADDATKEKFGDAKAIATNAAELGIGELTNTAIATTPVASDLEFTLADAGETYTFEVSETKGDVAGYKYDETVHILTFAVSDNGNGTLSVTVTLDDKEAAVWTSGAEITPVSIGFANSYRAGSITVGGQGGVALAGTKRLTGRPMVAGEFHFNVTNAKDQAEPAAVVATGTNAANGTITFTGIEYTTEKLNNDVAAGLATVDRAGKDGDVYTYTYNVSEDAAKNDKGISIIQGNQVVTVKVTDNRAGKLSAEVVYPKGGMVFKNAYGTVEGGSKAIALNGTKVLDVKSGNKVPDIAGKFTFTLTGSEGAPMPATTTATNDAAGNISFGEITYTMENVFGAPAAKPEQLVIAEDGADTADAKTAGATDAQAAEADAKADDAVAAEAEAKPAEDESAAKADAADEPMVASAPRSKTFTYTVTETGSVAGVSNDPVATKTIKVKVTDNGDGTLTVDKQAESNKTDFTFTNTYSVKPFDSTLTGEGGFAITKTLDGRDLREGEFEFALVSQGEGEPTVVTAKNDASGKVAFPAISFNAPGEYHYRLAEVDGGLGGVTYDTTVYDVTAKVVDNGGGTLGVTWSVSKDGKALEGKEIVFANSYKAAGTSITFNAAKVLTGRELKKGEFTFELRDANGKVLQTVKNGALTEGGYAPIAFDPITYDEPGTYDYRIVEVKGDAEGITYDETVFTYHVVVTDDGNGQLQVEWTVGETGAPVFQNVFVKPEDPKPADPVKPADPGNGGSGDKLVQTGDNALVGMFTAAFAGVAAIGAGFTARRKKK